MQSPPESETDRPSPTWRLILGLLKHLPDRAMSRSFGALADVRIPRAARRTTFMTFARTVGIDLSEVELPLEEYGSLNEFFVRRLRAGVREWPADPGEVASPVDGIVGRFGPIEGGRAIQAKGHSYPIGELLGDEAEAARYQGGSFLTIYLSPRHYHRIHTPAAGQIPRATSLPGSLLPVNAPAVMHIPGLFARNERLVTYVDSTSGRIAVVAVGAYNVGRISTAFDLAWGAGRSVWVTNRLAAVAATEREYIPPIPVGTGDEIMAFHLGSTVVLLFEDEFRLTGKLRSGIEVKVGERIGEA